MAVSQNSIIIMIQMCCEELTPSECWQIELLNEEGTDSKSCHLSKVLFLWQLIEAKKHYYSDVT